jgi:hypothetical protein
MYRAISAIVGTTESKPILTSLVQSFLLLVFLISQLSTTRNLRMVYYIILQNSRIMSATSRGLFSSYIVP